MFCRKIFLASIFLLLVLPTAPASAQNLYTSPADQTATVLTEIIDGTVHLYQFLRNDVGVYADAARFAGAQFHPCSIASVGMGLVTLCIADTLKLLDDAEALALQTLKAMAGEVTGFAPAHNPVNGFFRHWIDLRTGARAWTSEYSSIDTAILICGALFCKTYFRYNAEMARLADKLYLSVDWNASIANPANGDVFMTFEENGAGDLKIGPFNEYMIVAWLAAQNPAASARAKALWDNHFADPSGMPISTYAGIEVLTDAPGHFLSNFVIQFPYYLCHYFTTSPAYLGWLKNAGLADRQWWADKTDAPAFVWGTGAGASNFVGSGYNADNFNNNPGLVCSPHVLAGFAPVDTAIQTDIVNMWNAGLGVYSVPNSEKKFLWRFSAQDSSWRAQDVQGVDLSTLAFGLAAHPAVLGTSFFATYNDFDFPIPVGVKKKTDSPRLTTLRVDVLPNPFNESTEIRYELERAAVVRLDVYDVRGRLVAGLVHGEQAAGQHATHFNGNGLPAGVFILHYHVDGDHTYARLVYLK